MRRDRTIVAVYSADGTKLLSYTYDAFGNKTTKYLATDTGHGASMNYIGYRGYYYDFDLGLYFTQTRLYDPTTGRFISSDRFDVIAATPDALTDKNLYIYCDNDPVNRVDRGGEFWNYVIGGVVGAIVGGVSAAISSYKSTGSINWGSVAIGAASGAIGGLVGASGIGKYSQAAISGATSALGTIGNSLIQGEKIDWADVAIDAVIGAGTSFIGSALTRKASSTASDMVKKGIDKIVVGKNKYDNGSRYWKGTVKKGFKIMRAGLSQLNVVRGTAAVIGSVSGGGLSIGKTLLFG